MVARNFLGGAAATTLNGGINSGATSIVVTDGSTYPTANFTVVIDRGQVGEEKVFITSRSSNTLTVSSRGYDGTTASAHSSGAAVEHCGTALDFQETNDHVNGTGTVHAGATVSPGALIIPGAASPAQTAEGSAVWDTDDNLLTVGDGASRKTLVDTDSTQTLASKTLTSPSLTTPTMTAPTVSSGVVTLPGGGAVDFVGGATGRVSSDGSGTVYLGGTSTQAYVKSDGVIVSPYGLRVGADDTDHDLQTAWTSYTPAAGSLTNLTSVDTREGFYKIVGKTLFLRLQFNPTFNGTPTSAQWDTTLPASLVPATLFASVNAAIVGQELSPCTSAAPTQVVSALATGGSNTLSVIWQPIGSSTLANDSAKQYLNIVVEIT